MSLLNLFETLILLEDKIDFIDEKQGEALLRLYNTDNTVADKKTSKEIVQGLAEVGKKYLQWIANQYLKKSFKWEDLQRLKQDLNEFERIKPKLKEKDINRYATLADLYDAMEPFKEEEVKSERQADKEKGETLINSGDAKVFHKSPELTVIIPKTEEASCYFGRGTKWCTAGTNFNYFESYSKRGDLYIILLKGEQKYQVHFAHERSAHNNEFSVQFADARDQMLSDVAINNLTKAHPILKKAFDKLAKKYEYLPLIDKMTLPFAKKIVASNAKNLMHVDNQNAAIVLSAVTEDGFNGLRYSKVQNEEIVKTAVLQNGQAYRWVEAKYRTKELALLAYNQDRNALFHIDSEFKDYVKKNVSK